MSSPGPEVVRLMTELADALGSALRPSSLTVELQASVAGIRSVFSAAACSCALVEPDGRTLRFVVADGIGADEIVGVTLPVDEGLAGWVAISGQGIAIGDVGEDPRFAGDVAARTGYVPTRIMAAPMTDDSGAAVGVIEVLDPAESAGRNASDDLNVLGAFAALTCSVVRLARTFDALGESLLLALTRARRPEDVRTALAELGAGADGDQPDVRAVALAFHDLASTGPAGLQLAQRVLADIADFMGSRR